MQGEKHSLPPLGKVSKSITKGIFVLDSDERRGVLRKPGSKHRGQEEKSKAGSVLGNAEGCNKGKSWTAPNNSGFHPITNKEPLADLEKDYFGDHTEDSQKQCRGEKLTKLVKSLFNG